jgi:hypothetical protein
MKTILDPSFRYTASFDTDLKRTFARIRRDHRQEQRKALPPPAAALVNDSKRSTRVVGIR